MSSPFIHLRVHSDFSMMDGLNKVKPILGKVAALGMPAVAITDQMNMCGLVKFYSEAHNLGIKPIIGTDFWVTNEVFGDEPFRLTLIAMNNEGYKNITILISKAYLRGHLAHRAVIDQEWLAEHSEGVIVLSGAQHGDVGVGLMKNNAKILDSALEFYQTHFPDRFYLELIRTGRQGEEDYLH
ncbi:MAG TPA: DNA polymerase III subunit alpha, partial [Alteromonas macleodii]|nr:DNA polymerase III subunit alpha [Alteromonas macleodii]